jgi:initiation factor 1A
MPKSKNSNKKSSSVQEKRKIVLKDDETEYAIVTKMFTNRKFKVRLNMQNHEINGQIRGQVMRKFGGKIEVNSIVLVGIRDYEDKTVDIVYVYNGDEARTLKNTGAFLENCDREEYDTSGVQNNVDTFDFDEI